MFKKTIISEFFTTVSFKQALYSLYLMTFWFYKLKNWKEEILFKEKILEKIKLKWDFFTFYNWRSTIYHALRIIWVTVDDEVIISSYTCSVVVNSVLQSKAKLIYSDIEKETLWLDLESLKKNISKKTKVIILQNTFWKKSKNYDEIIDLAQKNNILIIEDCAHSLWNFSEYKWDFIVFSTGRDKVISSVTGWILVVNNKRYFWRKITQESPSTKLILKNLMYNIVWYKAYILYDFFKLWRITIYLSRKLWIITEILDNKEKNLSSSNFNLAFPNALAYLALKELNNLDKYTKVRLKNSAYYLKNIKNDKIKIIFKDLKNYNWFRFPILLRSEEEKNKLYKIARKNNIILWNTWSGTNIVPFWVDLQKAKYIPGSCPISEDISKRILTLPNHKFIVKKDMDRVIEILNNF